MFSREGAFSRTVKGVLGVILYFQIIYVSFRVSLDSCIEIGGVNTGVLVLSIVIEILFVLDLIRHFFTYPTWMRKPTLKKTAILHSRRLLITDFMATILSNAFIIFGDHDLVVWGVRLKLFRFFRLHYFRYSYGAVIDFFSFRQPKVAKLIELIITTSFECLFWLHILTCIWIKMGSWNCQNWQDLNPRDTSWMFQSGTDFTSDESTIFEQVIDD